MRKRRVRIKLYCDVDLALINMGLILQKKYPDQSNFVTSFDEEPFLDILFISIAPRSVPIEITDESIYHFNKYSDLVAEILKFKQINSSANAVSAEFAAGLASHMVNKHTEDIGVLYSEEHQLLCFAAPQCMQHVQSSKEVN